MITCWPESYDNPRQCVEKQRHHSANKGLYSQDYCLLSGQVWLWELDHKEGRAPKDWCFRTVVLQKTSERPLDSKEIKQSILKEVNSEYSLEGLMLKLKSSILVTLCEQPTHWKSPWCWERLRAEGEEGLRGWDGWMASLMQWTWTWANSRKWWGTKRPGMLQSTGWQRVRYD